MNRILVLVGTSIICACRDVENDGCRSHEVPAGSVLHVPTATEVYMVAEGWMAIDAKGGHHFLGPRRGEE